MARQFPEVVLDIEGQRYTLVFDWAAIRFFEREAGMSVLELIQQASAAQAGGKPPMLSTLGTMMQAGLQRHHPELDIDACMELFGSPGGQEAMFRAFALAQPEQGAGEVDPPKGRRKK